MIRSRRTAERPLPYSDAQTLAFAIAMFRIGSGIVQLASPGRVDRWVRTSVPPQRPASHVAWRMKGIRDIVLGLGCLTAPPIALHTWNAAAALIDAGDAAAVLRDRGRTLRKAIIVAGPVAGGVAVAISAAAAEQPAS